MEISIEHALLDTSEVVSEPSGRATEVVVRKLYRFYPLRGACAWDVDEFLDRGHNGLCTQIGQQIRSDLQERSERKDILEKLLDETKGRPYHYDSRNDILYVLSNPPGRRILYALAYVVALSNSIGQSEPLPDHVQAVLAEHRAFSARIGRQPSIGGRFIDLEQAESFREVVHRAVYYRHLRSRSDGELAQWLGKSRPTASRMCELANRYLSDRL